MPRRSSSTPSRRPKAPAEPQRPGITWAGTTLDASHVSGAVSTGGASDPVLAVWFDVTDPTHVFLAAVLPAFRGDAQPPLVQALFSRFQSADPVRPNHVIGATPEDIGVLKSQQFESITVDPQPLPEISDMAQEVLVSFVEYMKGPGQPVDEEGLGLTNLLPLSGEPGIDDSFVRDWFAAALRFWKARPWKKLTDRQIFQITFPEGALRICTVIGNLEESYGLLLYSSLTDYDRMSVYSERAMAGHRGPAEELPLIVSLNFDLPEGQAPDYLQSMARQPEWKRLRYKPYLLKLNQGREVPADAHDFSMTGRAAAVIADLAEKFQKAGPWPPPPGFETTVSILWQDREQSIGVRYLGR